MHKKRPNKHSKSKSNTLHFGGRHSLINKYKSKIKSNNSNSNKHNKNKNKTKNIKKNINHADNHSEKTQFKLPPLTQIGNNINNNNNNNIQSTSFNSITINNNILVHTSPSASTQSLYYTQKGRLDTTISISSETNYQHVFQQLPHSPSASYSFSDNNSSTNPDFIVIEPQIQHHHHQFHPPQHKHFFPPPKTFKFDDNDTNNSNSNNNINETNINPKYINMTNVLITNNQSTHDESTQSQSQPPSAAITPIMAITTCPQASPSQISQISQLSQISQISQLSHTERFQQLQPDPSATAMTPSPSPSAPNWSSSPMHPISLPSSSTNLENLDLNPNNNDNDDDKDNKDNKDDCNNTLARPKRYGSRSHLIDENENENENVNANNNNKRDSIKNVKIGQTTMHPYRVYNEHEYERINNGNNNGNNCNLLDKPVNSIKSIGSAISIETEHSISRSFGGNEEYGAIRQHYGNYNPTKLTTAHTNNSKKDKLKDIRIKLTPTTSTPIKSPNHSHSSYNNVTWQTYIGHFVFHEHDRGHSLYHSFKKIGEGVFARVYKTVRKEPQRTVALKVFPKKNLHAEGSFANELMLLHNVSHPNIVKLYDAHVDPKYFYLEMEVCRGGDIFKHISRKGRIEERHTRQIIYKIVDAIRCFHERDFVHRDLKPENIVFVHQNDISDIRLIDFGESIRVEPQSYYNEFVGTPCYFAPERFRQHTGAELKKSDVWAIGVIMFEMLTGCRCFNGGDNQWQVRNNVLSKKMEQWPSDLILSSNAMDFFNKLLEYEPLKRYSCQQALRHDWFSDIFQHTQQQLENHNNFHASPRLTPLQNAVNSAKNNESLQAIVIKTSQSMTNLQAAIERQMDARIKKKKVERKYKDINTNTNTNNSGNIINLNNKSEENGNEKAIPWKLRITRKKSRSLTQNELRATLRGKDGSGAFQRLSLPKHGDKYRIKHRSQTLDSCNAINPINTSETQNINTTTLCITDPNGYKQHNHEEAKNPTEAESPICVLKHEKSLSSPAMIISINNSVVKTYLPSPVHEDYENNDSVESIHSNQWSHMHMHTHTNSKSSYFGQPSVSYSANNNHSNHEKNNSFSINSTISYTEDKEN